MIRQVADRSLFSPSYHFQETRRVAVKHFLQDVVPEAELFVIVRGLAHRAERIRRPKGDLIGERAIRGLHVKTSPRLENVHVGNERDVRISECDADNFVDPQPRAVMRDDSRRGNRRATRPIAEGSFRAGFGVVGPVIRKTGASQSCRAS